MNLKDALNLEDQATSVAQLRRKLTQGDYISDASINLMRLAELALESAAASIRDDLEQVPD